MALFSQMLKGDQLIVVGDGPVPKTRELLHTMIALYGTGLMYIELPTRVGDYGCSPYDAALPHATGDFIWCVADDDKVPEDALQIIRDGVDMNLEYGKPIRCPHLFAMIHTGRVLKRTFEPCQVSGQQLVVPNVPDLPRMKGFPEGQEKLSDYFWIKRVIDHFGTIVYHDGVVSILTQQNHGKLF